MSSLRTAAAVAALLLVAVPAGADAQAQTTTIQGRLTAADGQPAAGVVTLLDPVGFAVATADAGADGRFRFEAVAAGSYALRADAPPQRSATALVQVRAGLAVQVDLQLTPAATDEVVVRGAADGPGVTRRTTIAGEAIQQLPMRLTSRGVQQALASLAGWASEDNGLLHVRGVDDGVLYVEDGVPVYDRLDVTSGLPPDPTAIGSLHVLTGYVPPEFGLKSGAVVEVQSAALATARWLGGVDAAGGSNALAVASGIAGGPLGARVGLGVHAAAERSERFLDPVHPDNFHNVGGIGSGGLRATIGVGTADQLRLSARAGRSRFDVPHGEAQEAAGQDQRQRLRQSVQTASWQRVWAADLASHAAVSHRSIDAVLRDTPAAVPVFAASSRRHDRLAVLGSVTRHRGRQTFKAGAEGARLALREDFRFAVTDEEIAEAAGLSDEAAGFTVDAPFAFAGRVVRWQWSAYLQDSVRLADRATLELGLRVDRTRLLEPAHQWSPRIGASYAWPAHGTTARASINRFFQPPQPEHLLLSSSEAARELSPFAQGDAGGGAALAPERQTAWEAGVEQWLAGRVRADAAVWSRHVRNYADPNVFFGTTIVFPNSVARGHARGIDLRIEIPRLQAWAGSLTYTLSKVEQEGPINGGLFLEDEIGEIGPGTRFTPDHDQRHVGTAAVSYQPAGGRLSLALAARYESGTPVELTDDDEDADEGDGALAERPGAGRVDFERGRVRPRLVVDVSAAQVLRRTDRAELSVRLAALNLFDRAYALNFGNPFSGTHFGAPRTWRIEARVSFR